MKNLKYIDDIDEIDLYENLYEEELNLKNKIRKEKENKKDYRVNQKQKKEKGKKTKNRSKDFNSDY